MAAEIQKLPTISHCMKPLRIILAMNELPLPFGTAAGRWLAVLMKGLLDRGHQVHALAATGHPDRMEQAERLFQRPNCRLECFPIVRQQGLAAKWRTLRRPFSNLFSPEIRTAFDRALQEPHDVVHLELTWTGWLGWEVRDRAIVNVHSLYGRDFETAQMKGWRQRVEKWLAVSGERAVLKGFGRVAALSGRLGEEVQRINPRAKVEVAPLGIDAGLYPFQRDDERPRDMVVGLIGSMNWFPTFSAARRLLTRLWPEIHRRRPEARLQIVGWAAKDMLKPYLPADGVEVLENVPSTEEYFRSSSVMLYAPESGSGMKVKVLEAFGYGTPVVTNIDGVEGTTAVDGLHAGICEDDQGLIDRAVALLDDRELQNVQRKAARKLLEETLSPEVTVSRWEEIYRKMLDER